MIILTDNCIGTFINGKWHKLSYELTIGGVAYELAGKTKSGNFKLTPKGEARVEEPKAAPPLVIEAQFMNAVLPAQQELSWPTLRAKVEQYMFFHKDGRRTTGTERMILADNLAKAIGCTPQCAWHWAKPSAKRPREKNIAALAAFLG